MGIKGLSSAVETIINVNGTERENRIQTTDQIYDIVEELGVDILVNGTQEGSFTQTQDRDYDISASPTITNTTGFGISWSGSVNESGGGGNTSVNVPNSAILADNTMSYSLNGDNEGNIEIVVNGNEIDSVYDNNTSKSGTYEVSPGDTVEISTHSAGSVDDSDGAEMSGSVSFTVASGLGVSVGGVTQS